MSLLAIIAIAALGYFLFKLVDFGKMPTISGGVVALGASLFSGDSILADMNSTQLIPKEKVVMENIRIERPESNIKAVQITTDLNNFSDYTISKFSLRFIAFDCPLARDGRSSGLGVTPAQMLNEDLLASGEIGAETLNEVSKAEHDGGDAADAAAESQPPHAADKTSVKQAQIVDQSVLNDRARAAVTADNYRPALNAVPRAEIDARGNCQELETMLVRSEHDIPPGQYEKVVDVVPFDHVIMTEGELVVGYDVVFVQASQKDGMVDVAAKLAAGLLQ